MVGAPTGSVITGLDREVLYPESQQRSCIQADDSIKSSIKSSISPIKPHDTQPNQTGARAAMAGRVPSSCCAHAAAAATTASSSLSRRRALAAAHSSATSAALRSRHPTIITPHLLLRRRVATATARGSDHGRHRALSTATSPAAADGLAQRLMDEEMTRKEGTYYYTYRVTCTARPPRRLSPTHNP